MKIPVKCKTGQKKTPDGHRNRDVILTSLCLNFQLHIILQSVRSLWSLLNIAETAVHMNCGSPYLDVCEFGQWVKWGLQSKCTMASMS